MRRSIAGNNLTGNFIDPVEVPATFKGSIHKNVQHFFCITIPYKTGRNTKYIGIVVFTGQFRQLFSPANSGTDALVFIGSNGNTVGASAKQNTKSGFAIFNSTCYGMGKIGIINRIFIVRSKIFKRNLPKKRSGLLCNQNLHDRNLWLWAIVN